MYLNEWVISNFLNIDRHTLRRRIGEGVFFAVLRMSGELNCWIFQYFGWQNKPIFFRTNKKKHCRILTKLLENPSCTECGRAIDPVQRWKNESHSCSCFHESKFMFLLILFSIWICKLCSQFLFLFFAVFEILFFFFVFVPHLFGYCVLIFVDFCSSTGPHKFLKIWLPIFESVKILIKRSKISEKITKMRLNYNKWGK